MPHSINKETIETAVIYSSLGGMGGLVHYLDQVRKGESFKLGLFCINIIISAWIGGVIGPILPESLTEATQFSIISMSGFLSYIILTFIEKRGLQLILNKLGIKK